MKGTTEFLQRFCPREYVAAVTAVNLGSLAKQGFRGLILDLDNTLTCWQGREVSQEVQAWLLEAKKMGFRLCLVSNALNRRVEKMAQSLGLPFVAQAAKPRRGGFTRALSLLGTTPQETVVIGDQLFTDIWGGNRAGLYTILVQPVGEKEFFTTRLLRCFERKILLILARKGSLPRRDAGCAGGPGE